MTSRAPLATKQDLHLQAEAVGGSCEVARRTVESYVQATSSMLESELASADERGCVSTMRRERTLRNGSARRAKAMVNLVAKAKARDRKENKKSRQMTARVSHVADVDTLRKAGVAEILSLHHTPLF